MKLHKTHSSYLGKGLKIFFVLIVIHPLYIQLEDCALQIYRFHNGAQGDYSTYLDLVSTIDEQTEELEGFQDQ